MHYSLYHNSPWYQSQGEGLAWQMDLPYLVIDYDIRVQPPILAITQLAKFGDRTYCQIWGPNVNNKFTFWHLNIHDQDLNINLWTKSSSLGNHITLGPHEAGVWAKHPSLTIPAPSSGKPSRHLGSSYQRGVSILSPLIADLSGLWGSSMQVMHGRPQGLFSRWQGG